MAGLSGAVILTFRHDGSEAAGHRAGFPCAPASTTLATKSILGIESTRSR
jgi:hypothetical protein